MIVYVSAPVRLNSKVSSGWRAFRRSLESQGFTVIDAADQPKQILDPLIVFNWTREARRIMRRCHTDVSRRVLVLMEPPATNPAAYSARVLRRFGLVWAASPLWASLTNGRPFIWPQDLSVEMRTGSAGKFDATMINACKWSAARSEQYSLRRQVIRACDEAQVALAVAGDGWSASLGARAPGIARAVIRQVGAPKKISWLAVSTQSCVHPRHYIGHVRDKADALRLAPVSVVIENSPDYVSEKLVDVVRHGAVPLYVGPPLEWFNIDPTIAITCPPDPQAIAMRIKSISQGEWESARHAGSSWLQSPSAEQHGATEVFGRLGLDIAHGLRS